MTMIRTWFFHRAVPACNAGPARIGMTQRFLFGENVNTEIET